MRQEILYFVKYPEPGKVKTRLAKDVGIEKAACLYRELAEENLRILSESDIVFHPLIVFDPPEKQREIKEWLKAYQVSGYLPQKGHGLGERLQCAFRFGFRSGRKGRILALGSDTMGLTRKIIQDAFAALESFDCVLGPAEDGGYYLIGLSCENERIFEDVPWSTAEVYQSTVRNLERERLSYYRIPRLLDLDNGRDLKERKPFMVQNEEQISNKCV